MSEEESDSIAPKYTDKAIEDKTFGISHLPLTDEQKGSLKYFYQNFSGYVTVAFGRMYQDKLRAGGGTPNTSNPILEAAAGVKNEQTIGQAALKGGEARAKAQIELWKSSIEKEGTEIMSPRLEAALLGCLTPAFAALNVVEAGVLIIAGQEQYKKLIEAESKGGVVDWSEAKEPSQKPQKDPPKEPGYVEFWRPYPIDHSDKAVEERTQGIFSRLTGTPYNDSDQNPDD